MFQPVDGNVNFPEQELAVGKFWKEHGIYQKSLAQRKGAKPFVFYEGPPTANGMPRSSGLYFSSTAQKNASRSRCRILRGFSGMAVTRA